MHNDHRLKRVLKRYRKGDDTCDASMDVSGFQLADLLRACCLTDPDELSAPRELNEASIRLFSILLGVDLTPAEFDYFLHTYVRSEFLASYFSDASIRTKAAPEEPPGRITPEGMSWRSVRPKDGKENFVCVPNC